MDTKISPTKSLACNTCRHYRDGSLCHACVDKEEYKPIEVPEDVGSTVERLSEHVRILRAALEKMLALSDDDAVVGGFRNFMAIDLAAQSAARAALEATNET